MLLKILCGFQRYQLYLPFTGDASCLYSWKPVFFSSIIIIIIICFRKNPSADKYVKFFLSDQSCKFVSRSQLLLSKGVTKNWEMRTFDPQKLSCAFTRNCWFLARSKCEFILLWSFNLSKIYVEISAFDMSLFIGFVSFYVAAWSIYFSSYLFFTN